MRFTVRACLLATAVVAIAGCEQGSLIVGSGGTSPDLVATRAVSLKDTAYVPPNIQVVPGDTVTFTNLDHTPHNVTFATTSITSTGDFTTGSRAVAMPAANGTYAFSCTIHPTMKGSVTVQ